MKKRFHFPNRYKQLLSVLVLLMMINMGYCQSGLRVDTLKYNLTEIGELEYQLPPLDTLIAIAKKNSPYVKYNKALEQGSAYDLIIAKRSWQENISLFGNYATGNQKFQISSGIAEQQSNFLNGYRYGINVSIPISEFTIRRPKLAKEEAELLAATQRVKMAELDLAREITQAYSELIAAQNILKVIADNRESARLLQQMAEKQFREGSIKLEEYAKLNQLFIGSEEKYELAKKNFQSLFLQMEILVGVPITKLIHRK
ncbi:MAG TPA: TolC family protein [Cytophagaceae bacterium]